MLEENMKKMIAYNSLEITRNIERLEKIKKGKLKDFENKRITDTRIARLKSEVENIDHLIDLMKYELNVVEEEPIEKSSELSFEYDDMFLKSFSDNDELIKAIKSSHKYIRKEGEGKDAKYIYKEKEMTKDQFSKFMQDQVNQMKKYRQKLSERLGKELGEEAYHEWIKKYAKKFREWWVKKNKLVEYV
jgi:hypothetical protein